MQTYDRHAVHLAAPPTSDLSTLASQLAAGNLEQRLSASWFGSAQPLSDERDVSPLRAAILWQGLPAFLAATGWQIAGTVPVEQYGDEVGQLDLRILPHDGKETLVAPAHAVVLAHRGDDRRQVTFHQGRGDWMIRACCTSSEIGELWTRWESQAFASTVVRGRVIDPHGRRLLTDNRPDWSDLFLPEATVKTLRREAERITLAAGPEGQALGLSAPRGLLFHGPSDSAKAMVARVIAAQSPFTVVWPGPDDLERQPEQVFELARSLAPSLLILEDLDQLMSQPISGAFLPSDVLSVARRCLRRSDHEPTVVLIATTGEGKARSRPPERPSLFHFSTDIPPADAASARRYVEMRLRRKLDEGEGVALGDAFEGTHQRRLATIVDLAVHAAVSGEVDLGAEAVAAALGHIGVAELRAAADEMRSRRFAGGPELPAGWPNPYVDDEDR